MAVDFRGKEVRELARLIELENRVEKLEERSPIQDEAIRRISDFVQRVLDDKYEKKGDFATNKRDGEKRVQESERGKNNSNNE